MYKKHSKFFNSASRISGMPIGLNPALEEAEGRRFRRMERRRIDSRHGITYLRCPECQRDVAAEAFARHVSKLHNLCVCVFCKDANEFLVPKGTLGKHIRSKHGRNAFRKWTYRFK